ncbi:MAG: helix-turn-helix domain-containing protein [Chloroflexota bacterium]
MTNNQLPLEPIGSPAKSVRRDAAENRVLILQTAEKLFEDHGVDAVNMADIAQAAGVGKGTLYRRFSNKGELCLALMDSQMTEFQDGMLARMQTLSEQGVSKLEQLDQFIDALVHFTDIHSPLLCVAQRAGLLEGENEAIQLPHFWQYMTVKGLMRSAQIDGELASNLDIDYFADAILSPLQADIFRYQRQVREFSLDRISAGLRHLVSGLK